MEYGYVSRRSRQEAYLILSTRQMLIVYDALGTTYEIASTNHHWSPGVTNFPFHMSPKLRVV